MEERELKLILSLEMAKRWYKSNDESIKTLALSVYTKEELEKVTIDDIRNAIDNDTFSKLVKQSNAVLNIILIANYFNKDYKKTDGTLGYFWIKEMDDKWDLRAHQGVTCPGIIYYKTQEIAESAFEIAKEFYEIIG